VGELSVFWGSNAPLSREFSHADAGFSQVKYRLPGEEILPPGVKLFCFAAAKFAEVTAVRDQAGFASYAGSCYRPGCLREPTHAGTSTIARVRLHDAHLPGALRILQTVLSEAERRGCEPECADDTTPWRGNRRAES
jgi:hypothetical protein